MEPIDKLEKQHEDILTVSNQLCTGLETATDKSGAIALLDLIEQLRVLLEEHLLFEDDFLYPILKKRPEERVRDLASKFSIELGNIKGAFDDYLRKWSSEDIILKENALFVSESKALLGALQNRIVREDNELFPLV